MTQIWTIHDELNSLLQQKNDSVFKRQIHDLVLFGYLRNAVERATWDQNVDVNLPFLEIQLIGAIHMDAQYLGSKQQRARVITLEKDIIRCDHKPIRIWKYRDAFVHVADPRDWEWLSSKVLDQLMHEEFQEFTRCENELQARATHFYQHGVLQ